MEPNTCPHCGRILSDKDVLRLFGRYIASKKKTHAAGPGRPSGITPQHPRVTSQVSPAATPPRREPSRESDLDTGYDFGA